MFKCFLFTSIVRYTTIIHHTLMYKIIITPALSLIALTMLAAGCAKISDSSTSQHNPPAPNSQRILRPTKTVAINGYAIEAEIATTPEQQAQGLSGLAAIPMDQGMLFIFSNPTRPNFWMKGMLTPIDIIWIKDKRVTGVTNEVPPPLAGQIEQDLLLYTPPDTVDAVLEVAAGTARRHNITVGDKVAY